MPQPVTAASLAWTRVAVGQFGDLGVAVTSRLSPVLGSIANAGLICPGSRL